MYSTSQLEAYARDLVNCMSEEEVRETALDAIVEGLQNLQNTDPVELERELERFAAVCAEDLEVLPYLE